MEGEKFDNGAEQAPKKRLAWLWALIILLVLVGGAYGFMKYSGQKEDTDNSEKITESAGPVSIPQKVLDHKFGWLGGGGDDDGSAISEYGGAWVRPHPGAFLWDAMQESYDGKIDFSSTDKEIKNFQSNNLGILVTIWPFADWDQEKLANATECKVDNNDEFLSSNDKKGRGDYLPLYRCNPNNWQVYQEWVTKIVERYDGDGIDDMPGLTMPVKYWEVMNEPDLQYNQVAPQGESVSLNFYKMGPLDYGELLKYSSKSIKKADSEAQVLIAGAAGGDKFLDFYNTLLSSMPDIVDYFDIGNIHCISNDQNSHDFNVSEYKKLLTDYQINKPIWVTEAEAFYRDNTTAEENFISTNNSVAGAIKAGAERIFFTRYEFDDFRTNMSQKTAKSSYPSAEKYMEIIEKY